MLLSRLWGIDYYGNTRTLDQHIGHIREKLGGDGARIVTVPRVGYAYNDGMSSECVSRLGHEGFRLPT